MREAGLTKFAAPRHVSTRASREREVHRLGRRDLERLAESESGRVAAQQVLARAAEQPFACAIDELELAVGVEREHGGVDLFHHSAQECRGLERTQALLAQG